MTNENNEVLQEILDLNFEDKFANSLNQIYSFIDQLIIEVSASNNEKEDCVKNLINLKSFIDNSLFEYKIKSLLVSKIESKKKENYEQKELENHAGLLEKDLLD